MFQRTGSEAYKKDLYNIRRLCEALGNPQDRYPSIHVAGTNGKGSTCHMLASILMEAGFKTGLTTSPHFNDFRERIRVDGELCSREFLIDFVEKQADLILSLNASFFEVAIAMAFTRFAEEKVDIAVIETGLGGRLDATNIITPILSVITNIGLDHKAILGDTLEQIAGEKAGIIKSGVPMIIGESHPETRPVFIQKAESVHAPLRFAEEASFPEYDSDLKGIYQQKNRRTVLCAVEELRRAGWSISEHAVKAGLAHVRQNTGLRGRWDQLGEHPLIIADTAHNPHALAEVRKQLEKTPYRRLHLVLGFVSDKDVASILKFFPADAWYYFSAPDVPRKLPVEKLRSLVPSHLHAGYFDTVAEACSAAKAAANETDMIYVGGSTFVVAEIL